MSDYFSPLNEETQNQAPKRPVLLTVLCILSFIVVGFGLLGVLTSLVGGKPGVEQIEHAYKGTMQIASDFRDQNQVFFSDMLEQTAEMMAYQQHHYWSVLLVNFITMGTGFAGVLMMFRGRKLGFHLYIIYNLLSVGGSFLIIPSHMIPMFAVITNLIFSGVFVFLYSLNLKWMKL